MLLSTVINDDNSTVYIRPQTSYSKLCKSTPHDANPSIFNVLMIILPEDTIKIITQHYPHATKNTNDLQRKL